MGVYECATSHFILGMGGGGGVQVCKFTFHLRCGWWWGCTSVQIHISSWTLLVVGVYECTTSHFILGMGGGGVYECATSHFILGMGGGGGVQVCKLILGVEGGGGV